MKKRSLILFQCLALSLAAHSASALIVDGGSGGDSGSGYSVTPGAYFTPFAQDDLGNEPDPHDLAAGLLAPGSSVTIQPGSAAFQGNTGASLTQPPIPVLDTVLGATTDLSHASYQNVVDGTSPLNGAFEALGIDHFGGPFGFTVSGYDDYGLTGAHDQNGPFTLYLSLLDGVNDPSLSETDFSTWEDGTDYFIDGYDPGTHADLAISGWLSPGDVLNFDFDPGTGSAGDGTWFIDGTPIEAGDADLQIFLDKADDAWGVVAVMDATIGGWDGEGGDWVGEGSGADSSDFMGSAAFVTSMNLGEGMDFGDGILLTSGAGTPPDTNTSDGFSGFASEQGDAGLDQILTVAGEQGLIDPNAFSDDATALVFDFTVPEGANAVSFDFMFATEEYPDWNFPDAAAIVIDGRNYAIFEDGTPLIFDPDTPVADILVDNTDGHLPIEYDGISPVGHVVAPLDPDLEVHTFKAVVSDANDQIFDTGIFLANLDAVTVEAGVDPSDPILPPPDDDPTDGYDFRIELGDAGLGLSPTTPIWIDPDYAVGYIYTVTGNTFASATLPAGFGDDLYQVSWWDAVNGVYVLLDSGHDAGQWAAGEIINFLTLVDPAGITQFKVEGIELSAALDPNDPTAFATGVSFTSGGTFDVNMTPIVESVPPVPEPALVVLLGAGLLGLGIGRRRL